MLFGNGFLAYQYYHCGEFHTYEIAFTYTMVYNVVIPNLFRANDTDSRLI